MLEDCSNIDISVLIYNTMIISMNMLFRTCIYIYIYKYIYIYNRVSYSNIINRYMIYTIDSIDTMIYIVYKSEMG